MSEMCWVVNATKKEQLHFTHIGAATPREFAGTPAAAAIVTWYLCANRGDAITFISDYDDFDNLPFGMKAEELDAWPDKTDEIVNVLVEQGILEDCGRRFEDETDPQNVYIRDLRNCW